MTLGPVDTSMVVWAPGREPEVSWAAPRPFRPPAVTTARGTKPVMAQAGRPVRTLTLAAQRRRTLPTAISARNATPSPSGMTTFG